MSEMEKMAIATVVTVICMYIIWIYAIKVTKKKTLAESKAIVHEEILEFLSRPSVYIQLHQQDIVDILDVIAKFSAISPENTRKCVNYQAKVPFCKVEIFDADFPKHFAVVESNIYRIFERIFSYNGVEGTLYVTYERTLKKDVYHIVIYWATTRRAKKALQEYMQRIAAYNRQAEIAENAPFIDHELEKEMSAEKRDERN